MSSIGFSFPVYRIQTRRLVIRCWEPPDAPFMKAAVDESIEHLRPWMPWAADEPQELQQKVDLARKFRGKFDLDEQYVYGIFDREESRVIGGSGLHPRVGPEALEIGYWVRASAINQGYATETAAALTRVAFEIHHVRRIEIHCDANNVRSAAVPRKLGYTLECTRRQNHPGAAAGSWTDTMIWTLLKEEYPGSPSVRVELQALDALGRSLNLKCAL